MKWKPLYTIFAITLILNLPIIIRGLILDQTDPYYTVEVTSSAVSQEQISEACPNVIFSNNDKEFLNLILNDSNVLNLLPSADPAYVTESDCARLIAQYADRPSDYCRISISRSSENSLSSPNSTSTYVSVEFYETEEDRGLYPSEAYPVLRLQLCQTAYAEFHDESLNFHQEAFTTNSYNKHIFIYSLKIPDGRELSAPFSWPDDAAYTEYDCETSSSDDMKLLKRERTLTPAKFQHIRKSYLGWFDILMSV